MMSELSETMESDAIRARNRVSSFPGPIGMEEMAAFAIGTFVGMGSEIIALRLNHIRSRMQCAQPVEIA